MTRYQDCDLLTASGYVVAWVLGLAAVCGGIIYAVWGIW